MKYLNNILGTCRMLFKTDYLLHYRNLRFRRVLHLRRVQLVGSSAKWGVYRVFWKLNSAVPWNLANSIVCLVPASMHSTEKKIGGVAISPSSVENKLNKDCQVDPMTVEASGTWRLSTIAGFLLSETRQTFCFFYGIPGQVYTEYPCKKTWQTNDVHSTVAHYQCSPRSTHGRRQISTDFCSEQLGKTWD